jgi:hypothetical protein
MQYHSRLDRTFDVHLHIVNSFPGICIFPFKNKFPNLLHGVLLVLTCRRDQLHVPMDTTLRSVKMTGLGGE